MRIQRLECGRCGCSPGWLPPFLLPHKQLPLNRVEPPVEAYAKGDCGYLTQSAHFTVNPISEKTLFRWVATLSKMAPDFLNTVIHFLNEYRPNWSVEKDTRLADAAFPTAHTLEKNDDLNSLYQVFILRDYFHHIVEPRYYLCWLIFQTRPPQYRPTQLDNDALAIIRDNSPP